MSDTRRQKGKGSIVKMKDGSWRVRIRWIDDFGKAKEKAVRCSTKAEAEATLKELLQSDLKVKPIVERSDHTVGTWFDYTMDVIYQDHLRNGTDRFYRWVRSRIGAIENIPLTSLKPAMIDELLRSDQDLSNTSRAHIRRVLGTILSHAFRLDYIEVNPILKTKPIPVGTQDIRYLEADQIKTLIGSINHEAIKGIVMAQVMLGLRVGEASGICWSDITETKEIGAVVTIAGQVQRIKGELVRVPTKTEKSRRTLPIPAKLWEHIKALPKRSEFVFSTKSGEPVDPRNVSRELDRVADLQGWKRFGTHILRHSFGVHSTSAGVPIKWVADAMGHTSSSITEKHYAKSVQHCIDQAVNSVSGLV